MDALGDEFSLTSLGVLPILVGGINDQVALFELGMEAIHDGVANGPMR